VVTTSDPAGQRLTQKGRATRDRMVAVAAGLMFERGVAGTGVDDVQREAGVSASQVYHYFADKRALVQAVIAYQTEAILSAQAPMLSRLDSIEALESWRDAIVRMQKRTHYVGGCPLGSLASELNEQDPQARTLLVDGYARWEAAIRDGLAAMRERGELRADADPDELAIALLTALQGGLLMAQTQRSTRALSAVLGAIIDRIRCFAV
jgi:TetR/AcrR family transcriptional repressor of nem operon